jgi:predicted nuclease of restriction endonuclease-like (RecB) superfamily
MKFDELSNTIGKTHQSLIKQASKAVNVLLTIRNWLIGCHIQEYEQSGEDKANYGDELIEKLSADLSEKKVPSCSSRNLWKYRQFYQNYPQIQQVVSAELSKMLENDSVQKILPTLSAELTNSVNTNNSLDNTIPQLPPLMLLKNLSFSHFVELLNIDDFLKRSFYEIECVKGQWSFRELKRQIGSLYYERSGLSKNKEKLSKLAQEQKTFSDPQDFIREPYVFEFLGISPKDALRENNLRDGLLDKIQDFLLEMGKGFCFEARNKRILVGDEYFFVDLVCYHRILKCHILIELKVSHFNHENIGQLNSYLSYYKKHEMTEGDNPPIGLLLCAEKNDALVEFALSDMKNQLFVSKYQLELPSKKEIQEFLQEILKNMTKNTG